MHRVAAIRNSVRIHAASLALVSTVSLAWGDSSGMRPSLPPNYSIRHWGTDDGLPAHSIKDLRQGPDGSLWIATMAGLVRFDGDRFTVFDHKNSDLANPRLVRVLFTGDGGMRVMDENTAWQASPTTASPRFSKPASPWDRAGEGVVDRQGRIWIVCPSAAGSVACRVEPDGTSVLTTQRTWPGCEVVADRQGVVWVRLASGEVGRLEGDVFRPRGSKQPLPRVMMRPSRGDVLTARSSGSRTELLDTDAHVVASYEPRPGWDPQFVDRFGNVWWRKEDEVEVTRPHGGAAFWKHAFAIGEGISAMTEDTEGDVWVGTVTGGLYRITPASFLVYGEDAGIEDTGVAEICRIDDGFLLRTWRQSSYLLREGLAHRVRGLEDPHVAFRDGYGTLWSLGAGVPGGSHDIVGRTPEGAARIATLPSVWGFPCADSSGKDALLFRDAVHVYRITQLESARARVERVVGGPTETIRDMRQVLTDRTGALWIASSNGVHRDRDGLRTDYTMKDGLPTLLVRSVHEDAEGTLWFGTYGGGLVRMKEDPSGASGGARFETLDASRGLAENVVNTILEDRAGNFWMAGNRGISRVPRKDLADVLDGRAPRVWTIQYGHQAGLVNPESSGLPGTTDASGRFWFPTLYGAAMVDPGAALSLEDTPVRLRVDEVASTPHGAVLAENGAGGFVVPAGSQRLIIRYTAVALRDPENVQLQYRLDGYDADWVASGTDRIATYTRLPPREYRFRVRAFAPPGRWFESETPVTLRVLPAFHQTRAFQILIALAAVGAAAALYQTRTHYLKRRAERLERTVAERTSELAREKETVARQVEQLQELERAKSRFFANVSHEFRTPLTLIQGPLEDLQDGLHGALTDDVREQVDVATRSSHRLLHLVDQLLDIARAESGRMTLRARRGDYRLFLRRIVGSLKPLAERKGIALDLESPETALPLRFDSEHLEKVLQNVIGNALKFTPPGGRVEVRLREEGTSEDSGWLVTEVEDDGPGISSEDLPRIFDRFHRGGGPSRSQPGAGIGLALAKELLALHEGTIQAESREGAGSLFTIRLPRGRAHLTDADLAPEDEADVLRPIGGVAADVVAATPSRSAPGDGHPQSASTGLSLDPDVTTVLVADDEPEVRAYVRGHLERRYRVLEAADGHEALEVVRRALPDLVVSDVMMPVMDGFELCRAIKADPEIDYIPVVLLTARASVDSRIEGLQEGADDYLSKPFNARELEARVDNLIASRRRLRERFASRGGVQPIPLGEAVRDATGSGDPPAGRTDVPAALPGTIPYTFSIAPGIVRVASADAAFLDQVRAAVEASLGDEDFDAEALARAVGASRSTLYDRLKELLGQSPMSLIRGARLEQAACLLKGKDGAIGEIAYAVGFRSVAHFSAAFKERYGATPSAYRRSPPTPNSPHPPSQAED